MKQNICRWNSVDTAPGDGIQDRFVGWIERTPGTDEEPILHVALHSTYGARVLGCEHGSQSDHRKHYCENLSGTCGNVIDELPKDFETMWRMAKKIQDAPENSHLTGHYRTYGM